MLTFKPENLYQRKINHINKLNILDRDDTIRFNCYLNKLHSAASTNPSYVKFLQILNEINKPNKEIANNDNQRF